MCTQRIYEINHALILSPPFLWRAFLRSGLLGEKVIANTSRVITITSTHLGPPLTLQSFAGPNL